MNATFEFKENAVMTRMEKLTDKAQFQLDQAVLADSNDWCPEAEGDLKKSGIIASGGGNVVWNSPYARYQYYDAPNKSKDKNPRAIMKWFEAAKAININRWIGIAQGAFL